MVQFVQNFLSNESGVTSVEYALLAAAASTVVGTAGAAFYGKVNTALQNIVLTPGVDDGGNNGGDVPDTGH